MTAQYYTLCAYVLLMSAVGNNGNSNGNGKGDGNRNTQNQNLNPKPLIFDYNPKP